MKYHIEAEITVIRSEEIDVKNISEAEEQADFIKRDLIASLTLHVDTEVISHSIHLKKINNG